MIFSVLGIITPVFLIMAAGYVSVRLGYFEETALRALGEFIFKVAMPALVFAAVTRSPLEETLNSSYLLGYGGPTLALFAATYFGARRFARTNGAGAAVRALGVVGSNNGFVGYPIALMVIGDRSAPLFAQNILIDNLLLIPLSMALAETGSGKLTSHRAMVRTIAGSLARNPLMITILISIAIMAVGVPLPETLTRSIGMMSSVAAPLALFVVGGTLAGLSAKGLSAGVPTIVLGKLVIYPALVAATLWAMPGIDGTTFACGVIFAGVPMMSIFPIIAGRFGEGRMAATALFVATVCSAITLALILGLLAHWEFVEI